MNFEQCVVYSVYKNISDVSPLYFKSKESALAYTSLIGLPYKWCPVKNKIIAAKETSTDQVYLQDGTIISIFGET